MQKNIFSFFAILSLLICSFSAYAGLDDGLVAYYPFNGNANDESGNGHHGTLFGPAGENSGGPVLTTDKDGNADSAYDFDGSDDRIDTADFDLPNTFSVSLWINPEDITSQQFFIGKHTLAGANIFLIGIYDGSYSAWINTSHSDIVSPNRGWQHIAVVVKEIGGNSNVTMYKNGNTLWAKTLPGTVADMSGLPWTIGQEWDTGPTASDNFNGKIDEVRIYSRALSSYEIAVMAESSPSVALDYIGVKVNDTGGVSGLGWPRAVDISPDGSHVYVAAQKDHTLAVFDRDIVTGKLTYVTMYQDGVGGMQGLHSPSDIAVSPGGNLAYVASGADNTLVLFSRNVTTGELTYLEVQQDGIAGVDGLDGANSVAISHDGNHVYVTGSGDSAVSLFSHNVLPGDFLYVETQQDGVSGVQGLAGADSVAISPDGKNVYVTGTALVVFGRNDFTGELTYIEMHQDEVNGAQTVTVSPDGKNVYVCVGYPDRAVTTFSRDEVIGTLTFIQTLEYENSDNFYLYHPKAAEVSPDGSHVFVGSRDASAVVVFKRNSDTGSLTFVEMEKDGVSGVEGLNWVYDIVVSPDNKHVYSVGRNSNAISSFNVYYSTTAVTNLLEEEQNKWDSNGDGQVGLEEAIHALQVVSGQSP